MADAIPTAPDVAAGLAKLGQRDRWTADGDIVFPGITGDYVDASALYRRFVAAGARAGTSRPQPSVVNRKFAARSP